MYCVKLHGNKVISASKDKIVRQWNRTNGESLQSFRHGGICHNFDISNNFLGKQEVLAVAANEGGVLILSLKNNGIIDRLTLKDTCCQKECWMCDVRFNGRSIIATCRYGRVYVIEIKS